ncbi:ATP dependent RNA helicase [Plasmodium gonderi]|uniref:ATP-dependent RNA helicase n=1 Tax=Plasmodium gonderi TaxID=77519 RepID=A0A1Y1JMQ4_PLAGO|nr:ATP dependent RNA helicase [Plasmodium gonderi]GAW82755.1 ATP dependent RNA helicase [Plasmodium gonderi]
MVAYLRVTKFMNHGTFMNEKILRKNNPQKVPFCGKSLIRTNFTTLKIQNSNFMVQKDEKGKCKLFFQHRINLSMHLFKSRNELRKSIFCISHINKKYNTVLKESTSENYANKGNFPNEEKIDKRKEGETCRHKNDTDGVKNKILNRHESIDLNLINIDEEIVNNLKFILKIDKLYMYQYIIFNEIFVKNCKHILVYNKTGTGKTLSYLLPLIQKLVNEKYNCNKKILILTQNIYLCKQLYIYILSIYPSLNVCILSDENDTHDHMKKIKQDITGKKEHVHELYEQKGDLYKENYGIHFYLVTPNKLEFYIKNYKNKKKNEKNVMNNILNCVNTIVVDEFDYVSENRKLIFNFLFKRNALYDIDNEMSRKRNELNCELFNHENYNIYLFTAHISEIIMKKINDNLSGFVFFDFVNGVKEIIQNKVDVERSNILKSSEHIIQLLSRENKSSSLCNLNISHFICKINTPSKYKYVSYFLNEFFFLKSKNVLSKKGSPQVSNEKDEYDSNQLIHDYMIKNTYGEMEKDDKIRKCIIFANSKEEVEKLHDNSFLKPHSVMMHSELLTQQKNENINLFKLGKRTILITTDIVSRGLDIDNVIFILNYSPPTSPNDYIHRSGRTGRGKEKGICLTMYHKYEYKNLDKIIKYTKNKFQVILCPRVDDVYKFSVDTLTKTIMKIEPEKYEFLNDKSKELLETYGTKIIAQVLSILLKFDKKEYTISLLSGKKNYVAVLIKDPFFEVIGDIAKCDEGYIADISSTQVNKIISLFNSSKSEYKSKGVEMNTIIELPPIVREKKNIIRKNRKLPWIKYKLQKKKIIVLGTKMNKYKRKGNSEIIKDIKMATSSTVK